MKMGPMLLEVAAKHRGGTEKESLAGAGGDDL